MATLPLSYLLIQTVRELITSKYFQISYYTGTRAQQTVNFRLGLRNNEILKKGKRSFECPSQKSVPINKVSLQILLQLSLEIPLKVDNDRSMNIN